MNKIIEIQRHLEKLYSAAIEVSQPTPLPLQVMEWVHYAREYSKAAAALDEACPQSWLPVMQLTGQSVELALKACLCASASEVPKHHDLVRLYCLADEYGYSLSELEQACIVHVSHLYVQDLGTGTRFKARYPASRAELLGGSVPKNQVFKAMVDALCKQAEASNAVNLARLGIRTEVK